MPLPPPRRPLVRRAAVLARRGLALAPRGVVLARRGLVLAAVLVLAAACADEPLPVGRVALEPEMLTLPYPGTAAAELAWEPTAPLGAVQGELRVFVHLLDDEGELVRTFDHAYPGHWEVGVPNVYPFELYQSALGEPLPAGDYGLTVGLHDGERRWPLVTSGAQVWRSEYRIGTVRVPSAEPAGFPELAFSESWLAPEPGADRQILGRRWLGSEGTIDVNGAGAAGRLRFVVVVPKLEGEMERTLEEGEIGPALRVASSCDGSEVVVTGTGSHRVDLAVPADAACAIRFDPNYRVSWPGSRGDRSVLLENLYWTASRPAAG